MNHNLFCGLWRVWIPSCKNGNERRNRTTSLLLEISKQLHVRTQEWTRPPSSFFMQALIWQYWSKSTLDRIEEKLRYDLLTRIQYLLLASNHFFRLCSLPKSVLEPTSQSLHVSHTSSANSSSTLGLLPPIKVSHFLRGVTTRWACLLLDVVGNLSTATTSRVRLVVPFSEWCGTLGLFYSKERKRTERKRVRTHREDISSWIRHSTSSPLISTHPPIPQTDWFQKTRISRWPLRDDENNVMHRLWQQRRRSHSFDVDSTGCWT